MTGMTSQERERSGRRRRLALAWLSVWALGTAACHAQPTTAARPGERAQAAATAEAAATTNEHDPTKAAEPVESGSENASTAAFRDGAKHFRDQTGSDDYPRHAESDDVAIADNVLLYQRDNGGWPKNWDPARIVTADEARQLRSDRAKTDTTLDNRSSYAQVEYLATVYSSKKLERHRNGCLRGLEYLFDAQHEGGGFPHSHPGSRDYHHHVTFMDDVTPGALSVLRQAASGKAPFEFLDPALGERARRAVERGTHGVLELQVRVHGVPTVWAGQYDAKTLEPTAARAYELPSLVSDESVTVVRYLMGIERPSAEVREAVEAAVRWFRQSRIEGLRVRRVSAPVVRYQYHTSLFDLEAVPDPAAPPLWARFYEIETNRPFMANRDGKKVYRLSDVKRERRTGYRWYGEFATALLEKEYPRWQARLQSLQ